MVASEVAQRGIEYWDEVPVASLTGGKSCERCKGTEFRKERDILDVWFDSGVSHYAVCENELTCGFQPICTSRVLTSIVAGSKVPC